MIASFLSQMLHSLRHQKLSQDIAYSFGSFAVLAVSGIIINLVIASFRDAAALGVFNLSYAVYIVASQFAVWGLHYSVLRHTAHFEHAPIERGGILLTASVCAVGMGMLAAIVLCLAEPIFADVFKSPETGRAIFYAGFGLALFPLNKVLLAYLNGLRRMKAFSILQSVRYIMIVIMVGTIAASAAPIENASSCFLIAEIVTCVLSVAYLVSRKLTEDLRFSRAWMRTHYIFGTKALMAGMFTEVNARVDVLMIGFFLSDTATGIYSFAAMLADGLYQILSVVRTNFNPLLAGALRDQDWALIQNLRKQSRAYILPLTLVLCVLLALAYYVVADFILPGKGLMDGLPSLLILLAGIISVSFLVPFDNLMMISGHPGYQTFQQLTSVSANVVFAALLIPSMNIAGAAIGTAVSYIAGIVMMLIFVQRLLGWSVLGNTLVTKGA